MKNECLHRIEMLLATERQLIKRFTTAAAALLLGATGAAFAVANLAPEMPPLPRTTLLETVQTLPILAPQDRAEAAGMHLYRSEVTRSTDTAEVLLKRLNIFDPEAQAFLRTDPLVQQTLLGRAGRNITIESIDNKTLVKLTARWGLENYGEFKRLTVEKNDQGYQSRIETLSASVSTRLAAGTIKTSLFAATDDARIPDSVAMQLTEIFSGDIDFHRSLRKGDHFSVVYETLEDEGETLRAGRVLSAEFINAGKTYQAMWFQEAQTTAAPAQPPQTAKPVTAPPSGAYYTLSGESLRRAFLASPMEFSRISSGFKMRFHPIFHVWRAHQGVDYAAPTGTPVRSVGDGIVKFAGVKNGLGNVVMLEHRNGYSTVYAHLSRIDIRPGQSVQQGQHIGLVGSSGWATGPHLHFEFRVHGVHHDPLTIARQSETTPVSASAKPAFDALALQVRSQLEAAKQLQVTSAQ